MDEFRANQKDSAMFVPVFAEQFTMLSILLYLCNTARPVVHAGARHHARAGAARLKTHCVLMSASSSGSVALISSSLSTW
jgi:hypothetical protein